MSCREKCYYINIRQIVHGNTFSKRKGSGAKVVDECAMTESIKKSTF